MDVDAQGGNRRLVVAIDPVRPADDGRRDLDLQVFSAEGELLEQLEVEVPWERLSKGLAWALEPGARSHENLVEACESLVEVLEIVRRSDVLDDVFWSVAEEPSWWGILTGGVSVVIAGQLKWPLPLHAPNIRSESSGIWTSGLSERWAGFEGWRFTFQIYVNDEKLLNLIAWVTDPEPPLDCCGGILALEAYRPEQAHQRIRLQLLWADLPPDGERQPR